MRSDENSSSTAPELTGKPLAISRARDGDAVVVGLSGELDLAAADDLAGVIREVEESEAVRIVIDLSDLAFIDSTGLQALLAAKSRSDGRLAFTPSEHDAVMRLFAMTHTAEILGL